MNPDLESTLSRSLAAIDKARRRAYATFALHWIATFAALCWFAYVLRTTDNLEKALSAAVVALVFAIFLCASTVIVYVTRMTKRILRAIDLAGATPAGSRSAD